MNQMGDDNAIRPRAQGCREVLHTPRLSPEYNREKVIFRQYNALLYEGINVMGGGVLLSEAVQREDTTTAVLPFNRRRGSVFLGKHLLDCLQQYIGVNRFR